MKKVAISVRSLVELIMRKGSIDNRYTKSNNRAVEGTIGHKNVQKGYNEESLCEVVLKHDCLYEDIIIAVEGRADGILKIDDDIIIDEIKTTVKDLETIEEDYNPLHWEQAKCYGYIYSFQNNLNNIKVQLTYYHVETKEIKKFIKEYSISRLERDFMELINKYKEFVELEVNWQEKRDSTIDKMEFPFKEYRKGQRELAVAVYKTIIQGKKLFANAPTGIGKTISTIFPTIKALGLNHTSKIFYLTSKTITREVAENSLNSLRKKGTHIKGITITAKDKVCLKEKTNCNPKDCEFALDYYTKINSVLKEILSNNEEFTRENIEKLSKEYKVCPFELSLDLSLFCDVIICDYNYVFNPTSYLKRFFDAKNTDYTLLIDEGHNLVDRGRDMYSTKILQNEVREIKKHFENKDSKVYKALDKVLNFFISAKKDILKRYVIRSSLKEESNEQDDIIYKSKDSIAEKNEPMAFISALKDLVNAMEEYMERTPLVDEEILDFYFKVYEFINISDFYNESYVTLYKDNKEDFEIKLYCVNPSKVLGEAMKKVKSTVIFSATLIPMDYYKDILGSKEDSHLILSSPFKKENRLLMVNDRISTKYKSRERSSSEVIKNILEVVKAKKGNYMVFFPSYQYMKDIYGELSKTLEEENYKFTLNMQHNSMSETEKEEFLKNFTTKSCNIGFCVLGGHFSEGIDLVGERLCGVITVGVGMPMICDERDIIRVYFQQQNKDGFNYSYVYPGMVKVLQGVGRCIRTEKDTGVILLIDDRYSTNLYKSLFPMDWFPYNRIKNSKDIKKEAEKFWRNI